MALRSEYIDPTDERIIQIVCQGCLHYIWIEKGSLCESLQRCSTCCDRVLKKFSKGLIIQ